MTQDEIEKAAEDFRVPQNVLPPRTKTEQDILFAYMRGRKQGFLAGVEHAELRWIKVDGTHPHRDGEYIGLVNGKARCVVAKHWYEVEENVRGWADINGKQVRVTHYMPLPLAPEAERK